MAPVKQILMSCRLRWCHTDLGANVLSWPRLIQEDKRFSQLAPISCGLSAEHFDGVLAHHLVDSNWTVHHVTNSCLYDHSPSPQVCAPPPNLLQASSVGAQVEQVTAIHE